MIKNFLLFLISLLFVNTNLSAKLITYNWYWGIENISPQSYFILNLKPEFNYKSFALKLNIPVEINSNGILYKNHWNNKEDIITKIDFLKFTNHLLSAEVNTLNNIILGNGELVYLYSNDLFYPLLIKKGFINKIHFKNFNFIGIIDDLNDYDLFFSELNYKYKILKTGVVIAYDNDISDIFDPYTEKPVDKNNNICYMNYYLNCNIINKKFYNLALENDIVKNLISYQFNNNLIIASGFNFDFHKIINLKTKLKYYQKQLPGKIFFNKFYEIERCVFNNILQKNSMGISSSIRFFIINYFDFMFFIEKVENLSPYSMIKLKVLHDFPLKIKLSMEIYNRLVKEWYTVFTEKERNTIFIFKSHINLSKHLTLNLDYLKSFRYQDNNLRGLHQVLFYSEFLF